MKKWGKWTFLGLFVLVVTMFLISSCFSFDFAVKPRDVNVYFHDKPYQPTHSVEAGPEREIHFVRVGDASLPPVVFVHGSPGHWTAFMGFMGNQRLLEKVQMVSIDRPGYGGSGRGEPARALADQAAALKPVLDKLGKPAILVGHSYGGPVIVRAAIDYPDQVAGLILVAASVDPALEKTKWFQIPADWKLFSWMVPTALLTTNREILPLKGELEEMSPLWSQIKVPVTIIQGGKDKLVPPGNADFAERMLVNASVTMVEIPTMNHFIPWQNPQLIESAIYHHLDAEQTLSSAE